MAESALPVRLAGSQQKILYDEVSSTLAYLGTADPSTPTSAATWKIQKLVSGPGGSLQVLFADGNALYDNVWDNRASLSYS